MEIRIPVQLECSFSGELIYGIFQTWPGGGRGRGALFMGLYVLNALHTIFF